MSSRKNATLDQKAEGIMCKEKNIPFLLRVRVYMMKEGVG